MQSLINLYATSAFIVFEISALSPTFLSVYINLGSPKAKKQQQTRTFNYQESY